MSESKPDLEPEPLDAEFEPAPSETPRAAAVKSGLGMGTALSLFILASLAGGALGYGGARYFPAPIALDLSGADAERAALTEHMTALEARLIALENAPAPEIPSEPAPDPRIDDLIARLDTLEADIEGGALTPIATGETSTATDLAPILARLEALESAPQTEMPTPSEPFDAEPLERRLTALETGQDDLSNQLVSTLQQAAQTPAENPDFADLSSRLDALEAAISAPPDPSEIDAADAMNTRLADIDQAIDELRRLVASAQTASQSAQETADSAVETATASAAAADSADDRRLAARALALTALRDRAVTGEAFEAERAALARLWRDNADLDRLSGHARAGVLSVDELSETYPGTAIRDAGVSVSRLWGLIELQRMDPQSDDSGTLALTALSEERLAEGDLQTAVSITEQLEGEALDAARDWLVLARARLSVDESIEALRTDLNRQAAESGADPS
ncbi:MAG: hypothetical protein GYB36_05065 [Alphaproteobacteria bacterium]|nr:hypothetical protein [Alphaproteobacteria bacterium]